MNRTVISIVAAGLLALASAPSAIAEPGRHDHDTHGGTVLVQAAALTAGEVRKVDKSAKKVTIKHGPIANVDMPAMTMVFPVADPAMLDRIKPGDRILFAAEKTGDTITVTRIEVSR